MQLIFISFLIYFSVCSVVSTKPHDAITHDEDSNESYYLAKFEVDQLEQEEEGHHELGATSFQPFAPNLAKNIDFEKPQEITEKLTAIRKKLITTLNSVEKLKPKLPMFQRGKNVLIKRIEDVFSKNNELIKEFVEKQIIPIVNGIIESNVKLANKKFKYEEAKPDEYIKVMTEAAFSQDEPTWAKHNVFQHENAKRVENIVNRLKEMENHGSKSSQEDYKNVVKKLEKLVKDIRNVNQVAIKEIEKTTAAFKAEDERKAKEEQERLRLLEEEKKKNLEDEAKKKLKLALEKMISFAKTAEEQMERNDKSIVRLKAELEERESAAKKDKEDNDNMLVMISKISDMLKEPEKVRTSMHAPRSNLSSISEIAKIAKKKSITPKSDGGWFMLYKNTIL